MRSLRCCLVAGFVLLPLLAFAEEKAETELKAEQADFDAFQKLLSGADLVGHFTLKGRPEMAPKAESYTIKQVRPVGEDGRSWIFLVSFRYGDRDWDLPLPIQVEWAGTTPMITLDNFKIPGMGTFNARVLFEDGLYAGTWAHGQKASGHLYGSVEAEAGKAGTSGE